ncbi:MAG: signal peptidase I [Candidatus Doudnabacteria bacterium]|nr:signal peptidase I [Candidatus Doudnabacteria bacterium]
MDELESPNPSGSPSGLSGVFGFIWDFFKVIIIALAIILPIRYFLFQPFIVSGSSMEPNFSHGEYLIIDEVSYRFGEPDRGDVVVMHFPKDRKQFFIKRIIGLPGETITIDSGRVTIKNKQYPEGQVLEESYLPNQGLTFPHNTALIGGKKSLTLGQDEYLVLGDNRLASSDSRDWGVLKQEEIVGRVFIRVLPLTEFSRFKTPEYSF